MGNAVELLEQRDGAGRAAEKGDRVIYDCRIHLNQGDLVRDLESEIAILGKRELAAGIEKSLIGMQQGGYRKVRIPPQLGYGEQGVADMIPPHAILLVELWLQEITQAGGRQAV